MIQIAFILALALSSTTAEDLPKSFYDLSAKLIDGTVQDFSKFKGTLVLVSNVASECGFTAGGYEALTSMDNKYGGHGLNVLAFPCNQFGGQEPGTPEEIAAFAKSKGAKFRVFEKIDVNGPETHVVYRWLKQQHPGDISWNFASTWIIDENEKVTRYDMTTPWSTIIGVVEEKMSNPDLYYERPRHTEL